MCKCPLLSCPWQWLGKRQKMTCTSTRFEFSRSRAIWEGRKNDLLSRQLSKPMLSLTLKFDLENVQCLFLIHAADAILLKNWEIHKINACHWLTRETKTKKPQKRHHHLSQLTQSFCDFKVCSSFNSLLTNNIILLQHCSSIGWTSIKISSKFSHEQNCT